MLRKFVTCFLLLILAACSSKRYDGPPRWTTDVSHIPDAIPKSEPYSRSGNRPTYRINGITYHVRSSSRNYREKGIASWYGSKFHSQPTSSGEIYNMLGMTAAHKSLPLPTYAKVTNLHNHKTVIVKINDRGPFARGRIIDLSYAAAKKLGMETHGTALVEVSAIDPKRWQTEQKKTTPSTPLLIAQTNKKTISASQPPKKIFLQAGTFRDKALAERLMKKISYLINDPVRITRSGKKDLYYRVEIGPLKNTLSAIHVRTRLNTAGFAHGSIVRISKA